MCVCVWLVHFGFDHYSQFARGGQNPNCLLYWFLFTLDLCRCTWMVIWIGVRQRHSLKWPQLKLSMSLKKKKNAEFLLVSHFFLSSVCSQVEMRLYRRMFVTHVTSFQCSGSTFIQRTKEKTNSYTLAATVCIDHNLYYRIVFNAFISLLCYAVAYK